MTRPGQPARAGTYLSGSARLATVVRKLHPGAGVTPRWTPGGETSAPLIHENLAKMERLLKILAEQIGGDATKLADTPQTAGTVAPGPAVGEVDGADCDQGRSVKACVEPVRGGHGVVFRQPKR